MKLSKKEIQTLRSILRKIEQQDKHEKIRINSRRKAQKKGKTISRITQKRTKPVTNRRVSKRRSSIR